MANTHTIRKKQQNIFIPKMAVLKIVFLRYISLYISPPPCVHRYFIVIVIVVVFFVIVVIMGTLCEHRMGAPHVFFTLSLLSSAYWNYEN